MSIEIISHRQDRHCPGDVHLSTIKASVGRAVISAVRYELGYGGHLKIQDDHRAKRTFQIVTTVMNKIDTTSFTTETDDEYEKLLTAVAAYHMVSKQLTDDVILKRLFPEMDTKGVRAFDVVHIYPVFAGGSRTQATFIAMLAKSMEDVDALKNVSCDDLDSAIELLFDGNTAEEVIALIH